MSKIKILVVDDEEDVCVRMGNLIRRRLNADVSTALSGQEALDKLRKETFDLVVLDIKMPGLSGIDVMREAAQFTPQTKFVAISAYDSREVAEEALRMGAIDFIHKPQTPEWIELRLKDILTKLGKYEQQP